MATTTEQVVEALLEQGLIDLDELIAMVGEGQVQSKPQRKERREIRPKNPDAPVSFRTRKFIAAATGVFPEGEMTQGEASELIDRLKEGRKVTINGRKVGTKPGFEFRR